ncbi:MAG: hypothetical protein ACKVQB_01650, partial [Bacteroidia bacterium]
MGRFERENIAKKVNLVSQVFAVLACVGILIIGIQLFSKTTGFDLFNINYSLSKLFSDETEEGKLQTMPAEITRLQISNPIVFESNNSEAQKKAESFLQNNITLLPIKSPSAISNTEDYGNKAEKFSLITIKSLLTSKDLFTPIIETFNSKNLNKNGIFPKKPEAKFSKWSIGISLSPGVSYRQIKYTNIDEISTRHVGNTQFGFYQTKKERNQLDKSLMKCSLALEIIFRVNRRLSFESGIVYLNTGESLLLKEISDETNPQISYAGTGAENHFFFEGKPDFEAPEESNPEENIRFANNISYIEIPVIVNYKIKTINELTEVQFQAGASLTKLDFVNAMVYNFDNNGYYLITGS